MIYYTVLSFGLFFGLGHSLLAYGIRRRYYFGVIRGHMTRVWIDGSWFIMVVGFIVIIYLYYVMSRHALKLLIH